MTHYIHLSDLHIHKSMAKEDNRNAQTIVDWIVRHYTGDDKPVVLLTGDIVDDGRDDQYENAVMILNVDPGAVSCTGMPRQS